MDDQFAKAFHLHIRRQRESLEVEIRIEIDKCRVDVTLTWKPFVIFVGRPQLSTYVPHMEWDVIDH